MLVSAETGGEHEGTEHCEAGAVKVTPACVSQA